MKLKKFNIIAVAIFLIFGSISTTHASVSQMLKDAVDLQEITLDSIAIVTLLDNAIKDASRLYGKEIDTIERAIEKRNACNANPNAPENNYAGVYCPQEVKSLKFLNTQLVDHMKMQRLGSIGLSQSLLCLTAKAIEKIPNGGGALEIVMPDRYVQIKAILASKDLLDKTFKKQEKDVIESKCNSIYTDNQKLDDKFYSTLGQVSLNSWMFDAIDKVNINCPSAYSTTSTNLYTNLNLAISYCPENDLKGADTDDEAKSLLEAIKRKLAEDEKKDGKKDWEAIKIADSMMHNYVSHIYNNMRGRFYSAYVSSCSQGPEMKWSSGSPWKIQFSCMFGTSENHFFNPFAAPGQPMYSTTKELKQTASFSSSPSIDPIEAHSTAWIRNFLQTFDTTRKPLYNECDKITRKVHKNNKRLDFYVANHKIKVSCVSNNNILFGATFPISNMGHVGQRAILTED